VEATRHQARERALGLLYEAGMKERSPSEVVAELPVIPDAFTVELLWAVERHRAEADALVEEASIGWPLERMPVLDRLVLRLGASELLDRNGAPTAVVIDEAVELAKTFSTEDSGRFVNGVLSTIAAKVR
jgi:transcription antitermination protein NusB